MTTSSGVLMEQAQQEQFPHVPLVPQQGSAITGDLIITDIHNDVPTIVCTNRRTGEARTYTSDELADLARISAMVSGSSDVLYDETRRAHGNPFLLLPDHGGLRALDGHEMNPAKLVVSEQFPLTDGTPVLTWVPAKVYTRWGQTPPAVNRLNGWNLTLTGVDNLSVGFCKWDNVEGILALAASMHEVEALHLMAGIIDPDRMGHLSARMTAHELLDENAAPKVTTAKMRKVLKENSLLASDDEDRRTRGRMRVLPIAFGTKKLPVAIAILSPKELKAARAEIRSHPEWAQLPFHERNAKHEAANHAHREEWCDKVRAAIVEMGWRVVDLPNPENGWYHRECPVIWATPVPENMWEGISRAAEVEAAILSMSRGSAI